MPYIYISEEPKKAMRPCCSNCYNYISANSEYLCCKRAYGIENLAFPPIRNKQAHTSVRGTGDLLEIPE